MTVEKQNVTIHACTDYSCLCRHRNFDILIGLLACDNPCTHGQFMPPSLLLKLLHFDWLINFETVIARNYKFQHGIAHFCTELQSYYTALDQSESSNFSSS